MDMKTNMEIDRDMDPNTGMDTSTELAKNPCSAIVP
jgi:hypothetical protein